MLYHHPELEIALMEKHAAEAAFEHPTSVRDLFRHATAMQKRNGAARVLEQAAELRREAAPQQARGRNLRHEGRQGLASVEPLLRQTRILRGPEQETFDLARDQMRAGQDAALAVQPLLDKVDALESDAAWLTRSADRQDRWASVKKALQFPFGF